MKQYLLKSVLWIPFMTLLAFGFPDRQTQDAVKEFVRVVNVEIIVRVSDRGKPVSGLAKSDFRLSENGQALAINGFSEFQRTMAPDSGVAGPAATATQVTPAPRLFILYFWLFEPGSDYQQALDYFFKTVYRANDRVLLVSLRRTYEISRPNEISSRRRALAADLDDFTQQMTKNRRRVLPIWDFEAAKDAREAGKVTYFIGSNTPVDVDGKQFHEFAASLKNLEMEKWILVFCHRDLALFSNTGFVTSKAGVILNSDDPDALIWAAQSFYHFFIMQITGRQPLVKFNKAEMEKMFIQSGATFHLLVLSSKIKDTLRAEQAHYEELQTGWQDVFAAISSATGGTVLQDTDMTGALQNFSRQQDIYYILTYEPSEKSQAKRKIKLELPGKNYDLFYDDEGIQRRIGKLAISGMEWLEPVLTLKVENYQLDLQPQGIGGRVSLAIRAIPERGEEMTFTRELLLPEKNPEIQLKLRFPAKGSYHLYIEAVDQVGQYTANTEMKISWTGLPASVEKPEKKVEEIIENEKE